MEEEAVEVLTAEAGDMRMVICGNLIFHILPLSHKSVSLCLYGLLTVSGVLGDVFLKS